MLDVTFIIQLSVSGRPMVVSSGMQSMETMRRVYKTVKEHNQNFTILQCTSAYPLEAEDVNLRVISVRRIQYYFSVRRLEQKQNVFKDFSTKLSWQISLSV